MIKEEPILIIDKEGAIGNLLAKRLRDEKEVVLVSHATSYRKRMPVIPDNTYSKIYVFYNGEKEILDILPQLSDKAQGNGTKLFFITSLDFFEKKLLGKITNKNIPLIILGDVFGEGIKFDRAKTIHRYFLEAKKEKIEVYGVGLAKTFPVFIDDVLEEIDKISIEANKQNQVFFLFPKHGVTELSLAHMLQKINPQIRIDFKKENRFNDAFKEDFLSPVSGKYLTYERYPLQKRISEYLKTDPGLLADAFDKKNYDKKNFSPLLSFLLWFLLFVIILPFPITILSGFLGEQLLKNTQTAVERGNISGAKTLASLSSYSFTVSEVMSRVVSYQIIILGKKDGFSFMEKINFGKEVASTVVYGLNAFYDFSKVTSGESADPKKDFTKGMSQLRSALSNIRKIKAEYSNRFWQIDKSDKILSSLANTIDTLPYLFGFEGKRKYLVLFQNNKELRPGGGFIGSYGIASLDKGRLVHFSIHDVYDADGQLKGHVEPPFAIRRHLSSPHWYLRDSNFDVAFEKAASASAFFLKEETREVVDGVIGIDTSFVKNLISVVAPLSLSDYKETVTEDNFYLLTQKNAEKEFFPGSTQKKDFLRSVYQTLQRKLTTRKDIPYLSLFKEVLRSIEEKHIVFAFANKSIENTFIANGLSSSLWDSRETREERINDFLGISETNVGGNKANYFIERSISQNAKISKEGTIISTVKLTYKNTGNLWPGGDYKNYLRIILPADTRLVSISIDDKEMDTIPAITDPVIYEDKKFTAPEELEIEKTEQSSKTIFGFLVVIPQQSKKTIAVTYQLAKNVQSEEVFSYSHKIFKQPGTENDSFKFSLSYPPTLKILNPAYGVKKKENKVVFEATLSKDTEFSIDFFKK